MGRTRAGRLNDSSAQNFHVMLSVYKSLNQFPKDDRRNWTNINSASDG